MRKLLVAGAVSALSVVAAGLAAGQDQVPAQESQCAVCHGSAELWEGETLRLYVKPDVMAHDLHAQKGIQCQECHGGNPTTFEVREAHATENGFRPLANPVDIPALCAKCHSNAEYMRRYQPEPKTDLVERFWSSVHGRYLKETGGAKAANCASCHSHHGMRPPRDPLSHSHPSQLVATCGACHQEQRDRLSIDVHRDAGTKDNQGRGTILDCNQCHGSDVHGMVSVNSPASPVFVNRQVETCGHCHASSLASYRASVHGFGLEQSGLLSVATCASCHGAHGIFANGDNRSKLHETHVAETCGQCHLFIEQRLGASVHGRGAGPGGPANRLSPGGHSERTPSCTDCHQGHNLADPRSAQFRTTTATRCGNCHDRLSKQYAFSLHGQLTNLGNSMAAKCWDCHGAHDILPVNDPQSRVFGENRLNTCRQCHPQANVNFVRFDPHADHHDPERSPTLHYAFVGMQSLLFVVFGFFGVHTVLWFSRSWYHRWKHGIPKRLQPGHHAYLRFEAVHRTLHLLIIISFLGLALTGLPLKYSSLPWAKWLANALGGFQSTSFWHRICALVTIFYFVAHLIWLGRKIFQCRAAHMRWNTILFGPDSPIPNPRDFVDLGRMFRWFVGLGPKPTFDRWSYWEKFDYWAVFWGVAIIGTSGLMLWLPEFFCRFLPGSVINIAMIIHSEEALLATGFIFLIHFFNTHLRAEKFPMDMSMLTGLVSEEELKDERPEFVERMARTGSLPQLQEKAPPRRVLILIMVGGFIALGIGIALLVGMIAALFRG